jgi:hypothetical protein
MARVTLISDTTDRELAAIRRAVSAYESVAGEAGVVSVLRAHVARGTRADTLDLVGHSGRHGFLVLGDWVVDDSPRTRAVFAESVRPVVTSLGVRQIRLLGCSTALTDPAWRALVQIARASECRALGTKRYISILDYAAEGFISDDALAATPGPRPQRQDRIGFLPHAATPIPIASLTLAAGPPLSKDQPLLPVNEAVAAEVLRYVDGRYSWVLPGLLAAASPIVLWSQANTIHRLEILVDAHVVRGYGSFPDDDHGRLYRVRDPGGLTHFLEHRHHRHSESPGRTT